MQPVIHQETTGKNCEGKAVLLLAKSAFAAAPHQEMQRLADLIPLINGVTKTCFAFSEQGSPSLRETLFELASGGFSEIVILPLVLPMETSFEAWLRKSMLRFQNEGGMQWPKLSISNHIACSPLISALLGDLLRSASPVERPNLTKQSVEGSIVPPQKRRVLVCEGGACNSAGADLIWGHLRNQQERQKLRMTGDGTMTAKSTCLGPCNLAPVMQVFPEGTYYGGVTELAVDRIIAEHLLGGRIVEGFAYSPTGRKQQIRPHTEQR